MDTTKQPQRETLSEAAPASVLAGPTTTNAYHRALIPLDGSPTAEAVIPQFVIKLARPLDLDLVLFQAVEPLPAAAVDAAPVVMLDTTDQLRVEAEGYLTSVADDLIRQGLRVKTLVRVGPPAEQIVEAAREVAADLIAMTTHGRSGLGRLFFGSVAEAVLQRAPVPLFLMRVSEVEIAHA